MTYVQALGIAGGALFAYSGLPEVFRTIKAGRALGTPLDLIATVVLGTVAMYVYTYIVRGWDIVLFLNYSVEFAIWAILLYYRIFRFTKPLD